MSEESQAPAVEPTAIETPPPAAPQEGKQETFDAEYVAKLRAESAKYRTQAKANEDAAKRLAELEESQKSEAQKLADRLAEAERKASEAEQKMLKAEVAAAKGVPVELLSGSTAEELEAHADRLLAFRGEAPKMPAAPPATGQGRVGEPIDNRKPQLTRDDLKGMTADQIVSAKAEGRLNDILGIN